MQQGGEEVAGSCSNQGRGGVKFSEALALTSEALVGGTVYSSAAGFSVASLHN